MTEFDWTLLQDRTLGAARTAFVDVQRKHPDETFYAFGLYTSGDYAYLLTTSNTEEGLTHAAEFYIANYSDSYKPLTLDEMRLSLRDSPAIGRIIAHMNTVLCLKKSARWLQPFRKRHEKQVVMMFSKQSTSNLRLCVWMC
jgi:hypothetical protein